MAEAEIELVVEQLLVVGAAVQHDGHGAVGVQAATQRHQHQLSKPVSQTHVHRMGRKTDLGRGNADAAHALVTDAKDLLRVRNDDVVDLVRAAPFRQTGLDQRRLVDV